ncbi:MAG TPA: phospholipase D-like domain-containing protein [Ignavibacteriaceae bacterium]|nr:phospholipase D-like domain-containing protein [Ignavibacteriaceae bacterium]
MFTANSRNGFSLKAYQGSQMTLLALDLQEKPDDSFAGFTLGYINPKGQKNFIQNLLNFNGTSGFTSSEESPIQLFKWVHFPGSYQQTGILDGKYTYFAAPRYFDANKDLIPLKEKDFVKAKINVNDYSEEGFSLGFTRAFIKSQAFSSRYGAKQKLRPSNALIFDTMQKAGRNKYGDYTYEDMYAWLGYSARKIIYDILREALNDGSISVDMFAYDFNDPVIADLCLQLASQGKIRIILDNADLHTTKNGKVTPEDEFEDKFKKKAQTGSEIFRCKFARYAHCKIIILKKDNKPFKILSGSTNFSFNGLYVNANHVLVFDSKNAAQYYEDVFNAVWKIGKAPAFRLTTFSNAVQDFSDGSIPITEINFSPHTDQYAGQLLDSITANVKNAKSILFSIMEMGETTTGSLIKTLRMLHKDDSIYTYGVTDKSGKEISLYKPGRKNGLLINAKEANRELPPQFLKEHTLPGHAIHHKFVVTDFNKDTARVYCGSSNLALGGEKANGDNLICIKDTDVATAFAIETLRLTDHYNYRSLKDKETKNEPARIKKTPDWFQRFYDENDIRCVERKLFA